MKIGILKCDERMEIVSKLLNRYEVFFISNYYELVDKGKDLNCIVLGFNNFDEDKIVFDNLKLTYAEFKKLLPDNIKLIVPRNNKYLENNFSSIYAYYYDKKVVMENSELTSEGVIHYLIGNIDISIKDLKIDIIGYGNCGRSLATWLNDLNVENRVIRRSVYSNIKNFMTIEEWKNGKINKVIVNTADYPIIDDNMLNEMKDVLIVDIASNSQINSALANKNNKYVLLKGIPNIISKYSAAKIISDYIERVNDNEG